MYFYQKEYPEALIYFEKALKIWLPVYDKNYLDVAGCYGNIGMMYAFLGNNSKALMFLEKALAIYRSTLGEEDNSTKETLEWIKYVTSRYIFQFQLMKSYFPVDRSRSCGIFGRSWLATLRCLSLSPIQCTSLEQVG